MPVDLTKREAMPPVLKEMAEGARARMKQRPATPEIAVRAGNDGWGFGSPYVDGDGDDWTALLFDGFATRSSSAMTVFLSQLTELCGTQWDEATGTRLPNPDELRAAIQIVRSMKPRNEAEACLCAQAVAVHIATMKLGQQIGRSGWPDSRTVAVMAKSARTYAGLLETMERLRGKRKPTTRQSITVRHEKHIHTHQHLHMGEGAQNGGRADGTRDDTITGARQPAERAALPSPAEAWPGAVPIPGGEGETGLPSARGRSRVGRSTGQGE